MGRVLKLMGAEPGEESLIPLLLIRSVFLGIFLGAFDIAAHSIFLSVFDEKMMARAYVMSGLTGLGLTLLFSWLQSKTRFSSFSITGCGGSRGTWPNRVVPKIRDSSMGSDQRASTSDNAAAGCCLQDWRSSISSWRSTNGGT